MRRARPAMSCLACFMLGIIGEKIILQAHHPMVAFAGAVSTVMLAAFLSMRADQ